MNSNNLNSEQTLDFLLSELTLEEKASLCSGADFWNLKGIDRLGIPSIMATDGPHGLRKQESKADHIGLNQSVPATCFPTASALASSWNTDLVRNLGVALAEECRQEKVAIILGPGANIKRSPLCGRNFEYFSEDPFLSGKLAAAQISGIQSQGIGASLKHFAVNNQETRRLTIDTVVDERALREIYLASFEEAVKSAQPYTVMCAYNRVNGVYCSESHHLLTEILKEEWGHEGLVVTDWGAVNDRVTGLSAGLELEMPGSGGLNDMAIVQAVINGSLSMKKLDSAVTRILNLVMKTSKALDSLYVYNPEEHHDLAYRAALESSVLLKNEGILPLSDGQKIAVIGAFAESPRYQGSGSSKVNPWKLDSALNVLRSRTPGSNPVKYAPGYRRFGTGGDKRLVEEAVKLAKESDIALVFAGLTESYESEGFDRSTLNLPDNHDELIHAVSAANPNTVVVLSNGAPVLMPWLDKVKGVLECYLGGQASGAAAVALLFGDENPSGKLAETFPLSAEDVSSSPNFPGGTASVAYAESIYVGYRYFEKTGTKLLFPFGFGLSYSSFKYESLSITGPDTKGNVRVTFSLTNSSDRSGAEIVQLYVRDENSYVFRPEKELKGFTKVFLQAGETREVRMSLDRRSFAFWDTGSAAWVVEEGDFEILVGASSVDIRLTKTLFYPSDDSVSSWARNLVDRVPGYFQPNLSLFSGTGNDSEFAKLYGLKLPPRNIKPGKPYTRTSVMADIRKNFLGSLLYHGVKIGIRRSTGAKEYKAMGRMADAMVKDMPLRNLSTMSNGSLSLQMLDAIILMMNGRLFKGALAMREAVRKKTPARGA